ncbi:MAG: protein with SnoaL 3 domain, NTF 2 superfamily [Gemmatimonadetes bacterium]|nr:protein with SnoaL 3 domain, NTF 2 superfamily [Gemmatimonadota bacterium]
MVALALLLGACARATLVPTTAPDAAAQIGRVLDDFHAAAAAADFDRYFGHFAAEGVFLGTDASERWTVGEFREYARPYFRPGGGWTYHPRGRHVTFTPDGRTAFFDELLDNSGLGETRGSGVMVHEVGAWKVAQYNLSIPIPNALADTVVGLIRRSAR